MAIIKVEGFSEFLGMLDLTYTQTKRICGRSIHPGAKIVANECKKRLENLKTDDTLFRITEKFGDLRHGPTKRQKAALIESMGIAKLRPYRDGYDVKLGFDGYNDIVSSRWPKGQPNAMIARSVNKGTSFMEAQPFMDQSVEVSRLKAMKAIEEQFDKEIINIWGKIR